MKIAVLTHSSIYAKSLVKAISSSNIEIIKLIVENKSRNLDATRIMADFIGDITYLKISKLIVPDDSKKDYLKELRARKAAEDRFRGSCPHYTDYWSIRTEDILFTPTINSSEVYDGLKKLDLDLILVFGTGIIKPEILKIQPNAFVNIHTSLLPDYRGTFPEFWQVLNDDRSSAGFSFHQVSSGIDAGDIFFQKKTEFSENPYMLRIMNILEVIDLAPSILTKIFSGELHPIPQKGEAVRAYRYNEITASMKRRVLNGAGF